MSARVGRETRPLNEVAVRLSVTQEKLREHKRRLAKKEGGHAADQSSSPSNPSMRKAPPKRKNVNTANLTTMSSDKLAKKLLNACKHGSQALVVALLEKRIRYASLRNRTQMYIGLGGGGGSGFVLYWRFFMTS